MTDRQKSDMGALLKERREYLGFSIGDIAAFLSSTREYVANFESGVYPITEYDLEKLATLYSTPVGYFRGEELPEPTICAIPDQWNDLEPDDREALEKFGEFLRWRKEARKG